MRNYNLKMEKRLSWININNQDQAQWIEQYIKLNAIPRYINLPLNIPTQIRYISSFMEHAKYWEETAENREFCRNLKAAWNMRIKRKNNKKMVEGSYSISTKARKKLESLAKKNSCSLSSMIEMLITDGDSIRKPANELNIELNEPTQLNELTELNQFINKLELREQEVKEVRQKLEDTEKELNISNQKLEIIGDSLKKSEKKLESNANKDDNNPRHDRALAIKNALSQVTRNRKKC